MTRYKSTKKRKKKQRSPYQKAKIETNDWCSRYVRIKAALDYATPPVDMLGVCYTCGKIVDVRKSHAGHWKSRGAGGHSGLYFDVRTIRLQCVQCNAFHQGMPREFMHGMMREHGESVVEALEILHKAFSYKMKDIIGLGLFFQEEVEKMCEEHHIDKWWVK